MLTETTPVDGPLLVSVTQLAGMKEVSKQAISTRLKRFVDAGKVQTTKRGREVVFSLAEWDAAAAETTDPAKLVALDTAAAKRGAVRDDETPVPGDTEPKSPNYNQELTRKARYDADLREMEVRRKRGQLLDIDDVRVAMERCAERLVRKLEQLPARAEELAAAVAEGGSGKAREVLKKLAREVRQELADAMIVGEDAETFEDDLAA